MQFTGNTPAWTSRLVPSPAGSMHVIARGVRWSVAVLDIWVQRSRQRRHLGALPPERLADIGVSASAAAEEAAKPFWRK